MGILNTMEYLRSKLPGSRYKYSALSPSTPQQQRVRQTLGSMERRSKVFKMAIGTVVFIGMLFMVVNYGRGVEVKGCEDTGNCTDTSPQIWGQYSPFFSVPSDLNPSTPSGCELTLAMVLSRHGARDPTAGKSKDYKATIDRIQSSVTEYGVGFEFLKDFKYTLGADHLTLFGEKEMVASGVAFYERYKTLMEPSGPFTRASGSERVIASAHNFTQGFYGAQGESGQPHLADILVVSEADGANNTMDHGTCPVFEDGPSSELGHQKQSEWRAIWAPPIMKRLNDKLPGANLSLEETVFMMDLCPFTTVATPDATPSEFCKLFSKDEWTSYDYYESIEKWYAYGNGNPLGSTQGVGYTNEVIARLTGSAVVDHTTTNSTLDSSPDTFPLDKKLYADFSHDNTMMSVYASLGLYNATADLPATRKESPRAARGFSAAWTVPFAARMYVEKMKCGTDKEELVRILVNDRVVPLQGCGADRLGRCKLGAFVKSQSFARGDGLWNECSAK